MTFVGKPRILFVDDEQRCLDGVARSLRHRKSEMNLTLVDDAASALSVLAQERVDLVISDMQMPIMSGLEFLSEVRERHPDTVCMILSGVADLPTALTAINDLQIFRFLTKPCGRDVLNEAIDAALNEAAARKVNKNDTMGSEKSAASQVGLDAAFDYLSMGLIVLDTDGHLHHANQRARDLIDMSDGLVLTPVGTCRGSTQEETEALLSRVRDACSGNIPVSSVAEPVAIRRPSMKRNLSLYVAPVPTDGPQGLAAVFILDPDRYDAPCPHMVADLFELTRGEANVVCELLSGKPLEAAADRAGVTLSTARTYLKRAFVKTGTSKQSELTSLVLRSTFGIARETPATLS